MLDTTHLNIANQTCPKLKQRYIGPFPIVKVVSPVSYELLLPGTMQVHSVFHVSRLRECQNPKYPMDILRASNIDKEEYQVEKYCLTKLINFLFVIQKLLVSSSMLDGLYHIHVMMILGNLMSC